jgi:signal transduction histidine kinase/CheY-like chemotaxis protein
VSAGGVTRPAPAKRPAGPAPGASLSGARSPDLAHRSASRVERWSFYGILAACAFLLTVTGLEVASGGDRAQFHVLDLFALMFIGGAATTTHRAFRVQREAQAATARAAAEMERFAAAETANLAKSRYLANVSHEIRSPLNAIYGYAQLVERDSGVNPQEAARVIRRCSEHLASLVEGLLDVSQIANGVLRVRSEDVRLAPFLEGIVAMMRPAATAKGLDFVFDGPPRLPDVVRMDPSRFRQVLINLLSNAIKFTAAGTVTLRLRYSGQIARFDIVDTGPGIAPEELERIFEPFERGRDEGKRALPGAGLGLSISRTIVEILGGKLEVESVPGEGTCFRVTMLLSEVAGKLETSAAPHQLAGYEGPQRTVLIADDEADQRHLIERLLTGLGFRVHAAANGETAIALATARRFDLAILDISMPGLSGWETAARLRDLMGQDLRILMLSANSTEFHRPEFDKPVHDFFLTKPVDFTVLTETIGGLLELSWKREQPKAPQREEAGGERAAAPAAGELGAEAQGHVERLRELLRIGYVRGIEAEIRELSVAGGEAEALAARLFDCLDRYDLAAMRRQLEEA